MTERDESGILYVLLQVFGDCGTITHQISFLDLQTAKKRVAFIRDTANLRIFAETETTECCRAIDRYEYICGRSRVDDANGSTDNLAEAALAIKEEAMVVAAADEEDTVVRRGGGLDGAAR